ncbi:protein rep [Klebsiella pneumoniae]|uniref:protein rep n=1 Tax=Klebsiella pneumoniae TaxID=573 RepID=UPI00191F18E9|nr:protein rep [Klebsiella pneumoniae]MBL0830567.1 protein rep [Klebsiella pneumoniae]
MASGRAPLGIIGKCSSTASQSHKKNGVAENATYIHENVLPELGATGKERDERVIRRFSLQSAARELLPRELVAKCMRQVVPRDDRLSIDVLYAPAKNAAHFGGLQICKSVWHCPVCSAKISERRREELTQGLGNWAAETAGTRRTLLVTFTLQHSRDDSLPTVFDALTKARKLLVSGRGAKAFNERYQISGMVRSLELTYGDNGWHPHLHVLMFAEAEIPFLPFEREIKDRWTQCVAAAGSYASWQHGCDVRFSDADIAAYVAKWGKEPAWTPAHELTKAVSKMGRRNGRTPMQLLADYLDGDQRAGLLWLQYAIVFKGQRQLAWSPGMRERLGLAEEKTDEEIAVEQDEIAVVLSSLSVGAWRVIIANDARGELLEVANSGDPGRVGAFLARLGIGA